MRGFVPVIPNEQRALAVRRLAQRLRLAVVQAKDLEKEIGSLTEDRFAPLTRLCGVNLLTAGTLAGILGPGDRFTSDAQLAAYAGVSPLETSSAGRTRHRLNRGGNRRLNAVLYRIALTQAHHWPAARTYLATLSAHAAFDAQSTYGGAPQAASVPGRYDSGRRLA